MLQLRDFCEPKTESYPIGPFPPHGPSTYLQERGGEMVQTANGHLSWPSSAWIITPSARSALTLV